MTEKELEAAIEAKRHRAFVRAGTKSFKQSGYDRDHARRLAEAEKLANS